MIEILKEQCAKLGIFNILMKELNMKDEMLERPQDKYLKDKDESKEKIIKAYNSQKFQRI